MLTCGICGSEGKMGKVIAQELATFHNEAKLIQGFTRNNPATLESIKNLNFIIDFSTPKASLELAKLAENTQALIICGTTGFTKNEMDTLKQTKSKLIYSANFSPSIKKICSILKDLAVLYSNYEVEILERHHSLKKDAPSGTALLMGEVIAKATGKNLEAIRFASLRQGNLAGLHEVFFTSKEEQIVIRHEAFNKNLFALGAIQTALKQFSQNNLELSSGFHDFINI